MAGKCTDDGWMDGWMGVWVYGCMGGWVHGWMDDWGMGYPNFGVFPEYPRLGYGVPQMDRCMDWWMGELWVDW